MKDVDNVVTRHFSIPSIDYAIIMCYDALKKSLSFTLGTTMREFENDSCEKRHFEFVYNVNLNTSNAPKLISVNAISNEQKIKIWSPSRNICLIGYSNGDLIIFNNGVHLKKISTKMIHGEFCDDVIFSFNSWDEKEETLLYQAERIKSPNSSNPLDSFAFRNSWGEKLDSRINPGLFLLSLKDFSIEEINTPPEISPASGCIVGDLVYFVGYHHPKFGLYYCYNRPSSLFSWSRSTKEINLVHSGNSKMNVSSLRRKGDSLYYLSRNVGKSHFGAAYLIKLYLSSMEHVVIDSDIFPERIDFSDDSIILNMIKESERVIRVFKNNSFETIVRPEASCLALDSFEGNILLKTSSFNSYPIIEFISNNSSYKLNIEHLMPIKNDIQISKVETTVLTFHSNFIIAKPRNPNECLVIIPHGGPNSVIPLEYSVFVAALCEMGYTVINVNYTGSIGFRQDGIDALEGQIGILEVDEVASVIQRFKSDYKKVFTLGGSHGGYIGAMISAKYPDLLNGCILRNPVIDLPSMACGSDIIDWPFGQMNIPYNLNHARAVISDELALLHSHSPTAHVTNVKCPTLIMIGERDLRVPPFHGKLWHRWLISQGVEAELLSFPDTGHSLDSPTAEKNSLKSILMFLNKYTSTANETN